MTTSGVASECNASETIVAPVAPIAVKPLTNDAPTTAALFDVGSGRTGGAAAGGCDTTPDPGSCSRLPYAGTISAMVTMLRGLRVYDRCPGRPRCHAPARTCRRGTGPPTT